nr:MAG: putative capsid protein [Jiangsu picobirnavirus 88]
MSKKKKFEESKEKGKRNATPKTRREEGRDYRENKSNRENDISWYGANSAIISAVANIPYSNTLDAGIPVTTDDSNTVLYMGTPGIMGLYYTPTVGVAQTASDAATIAARSIYSYVRHANSGSSNYDAPDLFLYLMAMDSVYAYWTYLIKIYGIARTFSFKNKYYPNALLEMHNVDPDDVHRNLQKLRAYINLYAVKMSSFAVPTVMPIMQRHMWMNSNVFLDRPTGKAQTYVFLPKTLWKYEDVDVNFVEMGRLTGVEICNTTWTNRTVDQLISLGDELLAPIIESEDCGIMSGDILKAYGSAIFGFNPISEDFSLVPTYSEEILNQIHNATIGVPPASIDQTEDGVIVSRPTERDTVGITQAVIDMPMETPTPDDTMYATRLTAMRHGKYWTYGSEVITDIAMYDRYPSNADKVSVQTYNTFIVEGVNPNVLDQVISDPAGARYRAENLGSGYDWEPVTFSDWQRILELTQFNMHPTSYVVIQAQDTANNASNVAITRVGDLNNFGVVSSETMKGMHDAAVSAEFGIPFTLTRA